jgi:hypothetical protein
MQQSPESPMNEKHLKLVKLKERETDIVRKNGFSPPYSLPFIFGLAYLLFSFIVVFIQAKQHQILLAIEWGALLVLAVALMWTDPSEKTQREKRKVQDSESDLWCTVCQIQVYEHVTKALSSHALPLLQQVYPKTRPSLFLRKQLCGVLQLWSLQGIARGGNDVCY